MGWEPNRGLTGIANLRGDCLSQQPESERVVASRETKQNKKEQRRRADSVKRNENIQAWCGGASETGCQRSVVIVGQAPGPLGASCHCFEHHRIMAYREGGDGM